MYQRIFNLVKQWFPNKRLSSGLTNTTIVRPSSVRYSYCEVLGESHYSPKHIRRLTEAGKRVKGGADTLALCGMNVTWDVSTIKILKVEGFACKKCHSIWESEHKNV